MYCLARISERGCGCSAETFTPTQGICFWLNSRRILLSDFSLAIRKMAKLKRTLDVKKPDKLPPFIMAEPNDDAAAFGWSLDKLRHRSKDSTKTDVWPGSCIFEVDEANELRDAYGFDINFINAKFVQVMLDNSTKVRAAAEKCAAAKYSEESRADLKRAIMSEFRDTVLPEILARFKKVSGLVADFYAARIAHLMTYGPEED